MLKIEGVNQHISYFKVPYKDIFVGIYILRHPDGVILFDAAGEDADVDDYIVPALAQLGISAEDVAASYLIYQKAKEQGLGVWVEI